MVYECTHTWYGISGQVSHLSCPSCAAKNISAADQDKFFMAGSCERCLKALFWIFFGFRCCGISASATMSAKRSKINTWFVNQAKMGFHIVIIFFQVKKPDKSKICFHSNHPQEPIFLHIWIWQPKQTHQGCWTCSLLYTASLVLICKEWGWVANWSFVCYTPCNSKGTELLNCLWAHRKFNSSIDWFVGEFIVQFIALAKFIHSSSFHTASSPPPKKNNKTKQLSTHKHTHWTTVVILCALNSTECRGHKNLTRFDLIRCTSSTTDRYQSENSFSWSRVLSNTITNPDTSEHFRILLFEEKNKEKEKPTGPPPKRSLADLPWSLPNDGNSFHRTPHTSSQTKCQRY